MTEATPKEWNFEPTIPLDGSDLANEVYSSRVGDLIKKLESVLDEAQYPTEEVIPALGCLLTIRFLDAGDPNRLFRIFIQMLSEKFDAAMQEFEED